MDLLTNLQNRMIIEDTLCSDCSEVQVNNCDLSRISFENVNWMSNSINNSNAPSVDFFQCKLDETTFYRSNLEKSSFRETLLIRSTFSGLTMMKVTLESCEVKKTSFKYCTLQRSVFNRSKFEDVVFSDFEGLNMDVSDCLFRNCKFELSTDEGMNGFSTANIRSCIFIDCEFVGYPLRGSVVSSCVFLNPTGHIADDISMQNTVGLESISKSFVKPINISDPSKVQEFVSTWR